MSETSIPAAIRRAVIARAHNRCEYGGIPEGATLTAHEPDHVIGEQHGGSPTLDNLAYACFRCNRFKGPNIATRDPLSDVLVALYNPRTDHWSHHVSLDGAEIKPLTAIGRGTALPLRLNDEQRLALRTESLELGRFTAPQA